MDYTSRRAAWQSYLHRRQPAHVVAEPA
jgi:hypothetical protein